MAAIACTAAGAPAPAAVQLGGPLGGLAGGLGSGLSQVGGGLGLGQSGATSSPPTLAPVLVPTLGDLGGAVGRLPPGDLLSARRGRMQALVRDNRDQLELDREGNPVRRGEVLGLGLSPTSLARAEAAGFRLIRSETLSDLGIKVSVLAAPRHRAARKALEDARKADPQGQYALDPIYEPAFARLAPGQGQPVEQRGHDQGLAIGLIDGGVGAHPAFAGVTIEQRGFAGAPKPSGHGTAVASLLVGRDGAFRGADPGAPLLVADVYGGSPANGSVTAILAAMGWLVQRGAKVINVSLVGPSNPLLEAGVRALESKGIALVAAVGNDGPAAPPRYPASYPGVVAVTAVDSHDHVLLEAGHAAHLDFAAPGADMAAAVLGGKWEAVRGTSFAAPLVAGRLARVDTGDPATALATLGHDAKPGHQVGRGIVCDECRTPPKMVGIR